MDMNNRRWYVPVLHSKENFILWAGEGNVRYFTAESLPDCVKVALAILMNKPEAQKLEGVSSISMENFKLAPPDDADAGLGWQISKHYFVVSLSEEQLAAVREGQEP